MQFNIVLILIFAVVIALFALFNASVVTVSFVFTEVDVSLAMVIIVSALIGALIVVLLDSVKGIRNNKTKKEINKKMTELEKQLEEKDTQISQKEELIRSKEMLINEYKAKDKIVVESQSAREKTTEDN